MRSNIDTNGSWALTDSDFELLMERFPDGIIAIDLETTGLSPLVDRIIEIAALKITKIRCEVFETLINPEIHIPEHTTDIHQITDEMVANSPKINDVLIPLKEFIGDLPIVAHNAKFDLGFIVLNLQKNNQILPSSKIYCSCKLARVSHPNSKNHKLSTLVEEHKIPLLNHHRAIDDAYASLRVFIESLRVVKSEYLDKCALLFQLDQFDVNKMEEMPIHLEELEKLVQDAAVIEMKYSGGTRKNEFRPVKLTSLLNSPDGNILYARCLLTNIYKSFMIRKITAIRHPTAEQIQKWLQKK